MQTTLLAVGIAIILALVAALVGPFFVDWSAYRGAFEQRAGEVLGMPVRIAGRIDARLLPTPSLTLRGIEGRGPSGEVRLKVREIGLELALGALLRGEWRATDVRVAGPEIVLALDENQVLDWRLPASAEAEALSIERLAIEDGRAVLADAASASRAVLEGLWFTGDVRSLSGPVKGEGGYVVAGERHNFRLALGRPAEEGARLRLSIDPLDRPLSFDADGALRLDHGVPRFEGAMTLARQPGVTMVRGRAVASEPWRLAGRAKMSAAGVLFEHVDLQYGPEERALKLGGAAEVKFGAHPRLEAVLSARQLDLDRLVALPEGLRRLPLVALRTAAEALGDAIRPTIPVRLGLGIDSITVGGAPVQALRGDLTADAGGWEFETLEFRAPGFAQVRASGRFAWEGPGASFAGPASLAATDPKALLAWLEGRAPTGAALGPLQAVGDLTLGAGRIAVERLRAEVDRKSLTGRLDYAWGADGARPKLEAEIKAADLDLDAAVGALRAALPDVRLDWPGELALGLDLGHATLAGFEARNARAKLRLDAGALVFERLAVEDFAGAGLDLRGRIDDPWTFPRGAVSFDLDGTRLDGVLALLEKASPPAATALRTAAGELVPLRLRGSLKVERAAAGPGATATLGLAGTAGALRLSANGTLAGDPAAWRSAALKAEGRLDADDGRVLARLFGLEATLALAPAAGMAQLSLSGPLDGDLAGTAQVSAGGLQAAAGGTLRLAAAGVSGTGELTAEAADVTPLRRPMGRAGAPAALAVKARLALTPERLRVENFAGTIAGSAVNGRLATTFSAPFQVEGRLEADSLDAAALLGALMGMPAAEPRAAGWPAQPFGERFLAAARGQVELAASRARLTPALELRQFRALLRLGAGEAAVDDVSGIVAGGRLAASIALPRAAEGRALDLRLGVAGADIAALIPGEARAPLAGRVSLQLELKGSGRTPASLAGALGGAGTLGVEQLDLAGLDPSVFDTVIHATDLGAEVDAAKVRQVVEGGLAHGNLRIARADGSLSVTAGQLRLSGLVGKGERAALGISATVDLTQGVLDARLAFAGTAADEMAAVGRPEIFLALKGPATAPQRSIDVSALVGWLTLRAVDLQARRLEAAEAARAREAVPAANQAAPAPPVAPIPASAPAAVTPSEAPVAPPPPGGSPQSAAPPAQPPAASVPPESAPAAGVPPEPAPPARARRAQPRDRTAPPPPAAVETPSPQKHLAPSAALRHAPGRRTAPVAAEQAPPLAPPIDIRPAPTPKRAAPRPRADGDADARPRPPAGIPDRRPSGLFDLFGAAR